MTDTYEFLKEQKDAILAKQEAKRDEWLTAALEDIVHYKEKAINANNEVTALKAELAKFDQSINSIKQEAETGLVIGDMVGMRDALQTILNYCNEHLGVTV